jgi:hypothetical protein
MKRKLFCCLGSLGILTLGGCVSESVDGSAHEFGYEIWIPVSVFFGGFIAAGIGWFLRESSSRFGWGLVIVGPLFAIGLAPSLFLDKAVVDNTCFYHRSGIWGLTSVHEIKMADVKQIRYIVEESRGRRGRKVENYFFICEKFDGSNEKFPINNDVAEAAALIFLDKAKERNIPFIDET